MRDEADYVTVSSLPRPHQEPENFFDLSAYHSTLSVPIEMPFKGDEIAQLVGHSGTHSPCPMSYTAVHGSRPPLGT